MFGTVSPPATKFKRLLLPGPGTLSTAKTLYHKRKNEALQGIVLPENLRRKHVPFSEIAEDAFSYSEAHKRSHRSDKVITNNLVEWFGSRGAEVSTGIEMEERLIAEGKERGWAASTHNHYRSFLMLAYREAKRKNKAKTNPARDIRHWTEYNKRVRYLSRDKDFKEGEESEYTRLSKVIRKTYPEHWPEFVVALNTGLRLGSQYSATYEMIDWHRSVLGVPRTKNGEAVHVALNSDVLAAIRSLPSCRRARSLSFAIRGMLRGQFSA
jgi:hypothetical protein